MPGWREGSGRAWVLGGGGFLGAIYQVGVLAGIQEAAGLTPAPRDLLVGTSAGGVIAALLAAGFSPLELLQLEPRFEARHLCRVNPRALGVAAWRVPWRFVRHIGGQLFRGGGWLAGLLPVLQGALPAALWSLEPLERFLAGWLAERGLADRFDALPRELRIPAVDLDTGQTIVFGSEGWREVPVSRAVAASCALPRFFTPVRIGGRDFVDGGIGDSLHLDLALEEGAREVIAVNPLVAPLNDRKRRCLPSVDGQCGGVAEQGLVAVMAQALKISHMVCSGGELERVRLRYPEATIRLVEPDRFEVSLDNPMDFSGRQQMLALGRADGRKLARAAFARASA